MLSLHPSRKVFEWMGQCRILSSSCTVCLPPRAWSCSLPPAPGRRSSIPSPPAAASWKPSAWRPTSASCSTASSTSRSGRARSTAASSSSRTRCSAPPPTERTEVRVAFNQDHLYIGVICFDSEPDKLQGNTSKRDEFLSADDRFMWTMDTFLNQQTGYFFEMNPAGLMADALMGPGGTNNREWDGIWNARVAAERDRLDDRDRHPVPHARLRSERAGVGHQLPAHGPPQAGRAALDGPPAQPGAAPDGQRRTAGRPHATSARAAASSCGPTCRAIVAEAPGRTPAVVAQDADADVGVDLAYNITPSLRGDGHDQHRLRRDRGRSAAGQPDALPAVLPEKRGVLPRRRHVLRLPDRRRSSRGASASIERAAAAHRRRRQADRAGRAATTSARSTCGPAKTTTSRRRGLPGRRAGGAGCCSSRTSAAIYTGRDTHDRSSSPTRHTAGADFRLATATFRGNKNLEVSGYWVANSTDRTTPATARRSAARVEYPERHLGGQRRLPGSAGELRPGGRASRRAASFRRYNPELSWNPRPKTRHPLIRRLGFGADPDVFTDLENRQAVACDLELEPFRVELHSGDNVEISISPELRAARRGLRDRDRA